MHILKREQKGFTLIEILVVIGILAILLAIVLVAINPRQQFQQANNVQRRSDVSGILNAISAYTVKNKGALPPALSAVTTAQPLGKGSGTIDLCSALVPEFIAEIPIDPTVGTRTPSTATCATATAYSTGYTVAVSSGRVTIAAPSAENSETISISR